MKKLFILILFMSFPFLSSVVFAEQMKLYGYSSVAPNVGETIIYPEGSQVTKVNRSKGYYIDGRGQVPEHDRIAPPNEEMIPYNPHPTRTVADFERYYDINLMGLRRNPIMTPWVPNYNWHYSNRRAQPYTKDEFIDVWCAGEKHLNGVDCQDSTYAITFVRARDWAYGVLKAPIKARKAGKNTALFLMVDELGLDAEYMHDAKDWSVKYNMPIFFGTIDAFIPQSWLY